MDGILPSISPPDLYCRLGTGSSPLVVDVRRADVADDRLIVGAIRRAPHEVASWGRTLASFKQVVLYCAHGHEASRRASAALRAIGIDARYLDGGFGGWVEAALPTRRNRELASRWITRAQPKIDRIACPWLIRRFIDPTAQFVYAAPERVLDAARETGATPYDVKGAEFSHDGERCSFDAFLRIFDIKDPALDRLAVIVRGADTSHHELAPASSGLFAISLGLSANFPDDHQMLEHGMVMYDALYTWCRSLQQETHNWPPGAAA